MSLHFHPQPKPKKGVRLRKQQADDVKASRTLSELYRAVYKRDHYQCVVCRRHVTPGAVEELERAHPHHIVFRSQAGKAEKHTLENVVTLCPFCHADVHDRRLYISGNAQKKLTIRKVR